MKTSTPVTLVLFALGIILILTGVVTGYMHKKKTEEFNNGWNYYIISSGIILVISGIGSRFGFFT